MRLWPDIRKTSWKMQNKIKEFETLFKGYLMLKEQYEQSARTTAILEHQYKQAEQALEWFCREISDPATCFKAIQEVAEDYKQNREEKQNE